MSCKLKASELQIASHRVATCKPTSCEFQTNELRFGEQLDVSCKPVSCELRANEMLATSQQIASCKRTSWKFQWIANELWVISQLVATVSYCKPMSWESTTLCLVRCEPRDLRVANPQTYELQVYKLRICMA